MHFALIFVAVISTGLLKTASTRAEVVVIANRLPNSVEFHLSFPDGRSQDVSLPSLEFLSAFTSGPIQVEVARQEEVTAYELPANSISYFGTVGEQRVELAQIDLGPEDEVKAIADTNRRLEDGFANIPVKILVDEEQPFVQRVWENRLRKRLQAASRIFEKYFRVRFQVVAVDRWKSDDRLSAWEDLLTQFERDVVAPPGRIAIGFSSQAPLTSKPKRLAGTHGILHSHILIREGIGRISEPERLEVLVHELGHFMGAAHSPEVISVMRPLLGDQRARLRSFRVTFDPINAMAIAVVSEDIRLRRVDRFLQLSESKRRILYRIYAVLAEALPDDPVARDFRRAVGVTLQASNVLNASGPTGK